MEAAQQELTRKLKFPQAQSTEPAQPAKVFGPLEQAAHRFGLEQRRRLADGESKVDVQTALNVHVALADSNNDLSARQMERLARIAYRAAGIERPDMHYY